MIIPEKFKLFGNTISVVFEEEEFKNTSSIGLANFRQQKITLHPPSIGDHPITDAMVCTTYLHECLHMIFDALGYFEARDDENLVELTAQLLYQILTTGQGVLHEHNE